MGNAIKGVAVCYGLLFGSGELRTRLEEGLEDGIRAFVVVVNNVHEKGGVHEVRDEVACRRFGLVVLSPLVPELISFVFPGHEADSFDDGRLNNLLAREHTPCYGCWSVGVGVRAQVTTLVDHIVGNVRVTF